MIRIAAPLLVLFAVASASASAQVSWDSSNPDSIAIVTDLACQISGSDLVITWTMPPAPFGWQYVGAWLAASEVEELTTANWPSGWATYYIPATELADPGQGASVILLGTADSMSEDVTFHVAIRLSVCYVDYGVILDYCGVSAPNALILADGTDPGLVGDFRAQAWDEALLLDWTATGDDGSTGTASSLDVRISTDAPGADIDAWWAAARPPGVTGAPLPAGASQHLRIEGLPPLTHYYLAVLTRDERNNGTLSNVAEATTAAPNAGGSGAKGKRGCAASASAGPWAASGLLAILGLGRRRTR